MKRVLTSAAVFFAIVVPTLADASSVEDVTLSADPQDIVLTVASSEALHAPTVRTYPGAVRIRFYDAKETPVLRLTGDGGAVKSVDVGSGSDQSAALVMAFGDRTRLAPTDVRVERDAHKVVFKISRGLLPALHEGSPMPVSAKPVVVKALPSTQIAHASAPAAPVVAAPVAEPEPVAPVAVAAVATPVAAAPAAAAPAAPSEGLGAKKAKAKPSKAEELKLAQGGSSAMPVLLSVSALLAFAYGAMRLMMKKNSNVDGIPVIDIVAQKRLGPRHQLVIVRAFDRDYLLSIQGSQTTVVARSSRKKADGQSVDDTQSHQLSPLSMLPMTASALGAAKRASAPAGRDFEDDEVTFGGELFKSALEQRDKVRESTASFRLETARAEARAELARLDAAREDFASTVEPLSSPLPSSVSRSAAPAVARSAAPIAAPVSKSLAPASVLERNLESSLEREAARDEERDRAVSDVPDGMSESVSGLLRLRKASGR